MGQVIYMYEGAKPPRAPPFDSDIIIFCEQFKYFFSNGSLLFRL
jgi:hypothetical protein